MNLRATVGLLPQSPGWVLAVCLWAVVVPGACGQRLEPVDKAWFEEHYTKYEYRVPMRDGTRLMTAVYAPKDAPGGLPILFTRTPYSIRPYGADSLPDPKGLIRWFARDLFIFAVQDVRGRFGSEGTFLHVRPIRPADAGPVATDESTDVWDSIDWMLKNIPGHNGNVGLSGVSYPGFYSSAGAIDSHPALKAVSPQAPIGDWFVGDDFRHNGCLYLAHAFNFLAQFEPPLEKPTRQTPKPFDFETPDGYAFYLELGPLSNADARFFKGRVPFWNDLMAHDTYDEFWRSRNILPRLRNIRAAVLNVGGWFDAEDLYGTLATYHSVESLNPGITNTLVMGPWAHGQWHSDDGSRLGALNFRSKTAEYFRQEVELPFFRHHLKGGTNPALSEAIVFETGTCRWRRYPEWPPSQARDRAFHLLPGGRLGPTAAADVAFDEFVSDPARPVPFIPGIAPTMTREHMLDDQRFASTRPDVMVYQTPPLEADLTVAGPVTASLHVTTSGTDSDWVVKLIDVYPGNHPNPDPNPEGVQMGGYQQLVRGEAMRGKFRQGFDKPVPFEPGRVTPVKWVMPDVNHTFRSGHRVMVQVQCSWFPLIDRNPQTFTRIGDAVEADFRKATQRIHLGGAAPSVITVKVLDPGP